MAIIDDDEWIRRGRADALREAGDAGAIVIADHGQALAWTSEWDDVDIVLIDAHDATGAWDRFRGVQVVERIRSRRPRDEVRVVVVTGHAANDLLRVRFAEAGADFLFDHLAVRDIDSLRQVLFSADRTAALAPTWPRVNRALQAIDDAGAGSAFEPGRLQKQIQLSRRQVIGWRGRLGWLVPGAGSTPPWRQVVEVVNRARGVYPDDQDDG